jgi:hypothetical protein
LWNIGICSEPEVNDMSESRETARLEQTEEEILTYTVSDEALEAAAGTERGAQRTLGASLQGCC